MKEEFYGMDDLEHAREAQRTLRNLHIPTAPVMSYEALLLDVDGTKIHRIVSKSNSYVRNAYNMVARAVGFTMYPTGYEEIYDDGYISNKDSTGEVHVTGLNYGQTFWNKSGRLGVGATGPDTLNDYIMANDILDANYSRINTTYEFDWNAVDRKMIMKAIITFYNANLPETAYGINEAGMTKDLGGTSSYLLFVRDTFPPITVGFGQTLQFTYTSELLFP